MKKRRGASLINVMVFMMFTVMVTAQVFFFSKTSSDSLAEEREIMLYRLRLDSLVEEAKDKLKVTGTGEIIHDGNLHTLQNNTTSVTSIYQGTTSIYTTPLKYSGFYDGTKLLDENNLGNEWKNSNYHVRIHDLDYSFDATGETDGTTFSTTDRNKWTSEYGNTNAHKKLFAAMPPLSDDNVTPATETTPEIHTYTITNRFYLIRAWVQLPENFFNRKIMYQVLVSRDERESTPISQTYHNVDVLSFQEVWF